VNIVPIFAAMKSLRLAVQSSSAAGSAAESPSLLSELAAVKANVVRLEAEVHKLKGLSQR
jgi:hypothetical protein